MSKSAEENESSQAILVKPLPRNGQETRIFETSRGSCNLDLKGSDFLERSNQRNPNPNSIKILRHPTDP